MIVTYPPVLAEVMDRFPAVDHDRLAWWSTSSPPATAPARDVAYDPLRVRAHLAELLGGESLWIPISARVRAAMAADPRYPPAFADTWTPLIDAARLGARAGLARRRPPPPGDRPARPRPPAEVAGRPAALLAAYCAGRDCEVRFLGGAHYARARPGAGRPTGGSRPSAPRCAASSPTSTSSCTSRRRLRRGVRPSALEAMAAGVPVILPPEFAPTFGAAALYAAPAEVWEFVSALWRDRGFWEARAVAGRAFAAANCDHDAFPAPPRPAGGGRARRRARCRREPAPALRHRAGLRASGTLCPAPRRPRRPDAADRRASR